MAWYKVKLSDGAEHRLWFNHDPSEKDVLEAASAPSMAAGQAQTPAQDAEALKQEQTATADVLARHPEPNPPSVMGKAALLGLTAPGSPLMAPLGAAAAGPLGRLAQVFSKPAVVGGAVGAAGGYLEDGAKGAAIGAAAGAGLPVAGHGIGKVLGKAIAEGAAASVAKNAPKAESAVEALTKTLVESGWKPEQATTAAQNAVARMVAEVTPAVESKAAASAAQMSAMTQQGRAAAQAAEATLPAQFNPEDLQIIAKLRQLAQVSGKNKIEVVQAAQKVFPKSWQQVMEYVMAPRTKMGTINPPGPGWTPPPTPSLE